LGSLLKLCGYVLLWFAGVVAVLAAGGAAYQFIGTANDERTFPPPGKLIDVGGYRLHLICVGDGSPTVILDAMGDGTSVNWAWVQPEVGRQTRTCAYDRAGRGWSEPSSKPRDAMSVAAELHTLLANAQIEPPYVMVGHSYGGFITRAYAASFPDQVAGAVLIDGGQPEIRSERIPEKARKQAAADDLLMSIAPVFARLGAFRMIGGAQNGLPTHERAAYAAHYASSKLWDSMYEEQLKALPVTDEQVRRTGSLGDRPLMIVNPGKPDDEVRRAYDELQIELLALSTNSARYVVEDATHGSLVFDQHDASETSAQILRVVEAARTGSRLDGSSPRPQ
jgi:pimeloyl-ACP methyl ester carboxylesterase